jgi:RNA polymerase sigma-70 factor (ECF subfamily)
MQETFTRAIRAGEAPNDPDDARRWLYRIATNATIDRLRRERLLRFVPFLGRERAPEANSDEVDLVRRALRAIPPEQATALVLRLHEGFVPSEIAAILGLSEAGVKSRLVRGRRRFIDAYERMGGRL